MQKKAFTRTRKESIHWPYHDKSFVWDPRIETRSYMDTIEFISSLYVCMAIKYIIVLFVETPRKFITAKLSIRKPGSSSMLIICDLFNSHALFYIQK